MNSVKIESSDFVTSQRAREEIFKVLHRKPRVASEVEPLDHVLVPGDGEQRTGGGRARGPSAHPRDRGSGHSAAQTKTWLTLKLRRRLYFNRANGIKIIITNTKVAFKKINSSEFF